MPLTQGPLVPTALRQSAGLLHDEQWKTAGGEPEGSSPLQPRHPRAVGHRMPLVQLGVRVDDLRIPQQPVAEVVHFGGDGEDAAQTFIKIRFLPCHCPSVGASWQWLDAGSCASSRVPLRTTVIS